MGNKIERDELIVKLRRNWHVADMTGRVTHAAADLLTEDAELIEQLSADLERAQFHYQTERDVRNGALVKLLDYHRDPSRLKVAVCGALIAINGDDPIVPPTAIDWIGDEIVQWIVREA